jgi:hypothetical protein
MTASLAGRAKPFQVKPSPFEEAVRKDSAVHVSLSSDSLFKQPGALQLRPPDRHRRNRKPAHSDAAARTWPRLNGRMLGHRVNSEGLRRRDTALSGSAPKRRYIVFGLRFCQPSDTRRITEKAAIFAGFAQRRRSAVRGRCRGPLRTDLSSEFGT